jgi:methionyl-tRNA synthetase
MNNFKRYMITAALPYANGPVHIGHLAGVYIPADIYVRYLKQRGRDVKFVCGSDEHGVPITIKARQEGVSPQVIVDKYHQIIKDSFQQFGIQFDIYSRTSNQVHKETSADFFTTLHEKGEFLERTTEQFYDEEAKQFLADRYITGTCPHCHNEKAYGDQCEKCGTSLNATDLINPVSTISGSKPILRETRHWFLPLDKYQPFLEKWINSHEKEWKSNVVGQCKSWFNQGLQPRAVSRDLDWGVPVPLPDAQGKVLYVWFDAPIGYISATKELAAEQNFNWELYWKDKETKLVHFIGKDNIVFHCIVFPGMLNAHGEYILPDNVPANEFLNLEGDKISTSRNWAVWLHEYLNDFPDKQDVLRYTLCANAPETKDNDFTWKDFQDRNNNELVAILGNFVNRALVLTQKYYDSKMPVCNALNETDQLTIDAIFNFKKTLEQQLETFHFREALKAAMDIARLGNKYLADNEPWKLIKTDPERVKTILHISLQLTAQLTVVFEPLLPFTANKIRRMLNIALQPWDDNKFNILQEGHQLNTPELLFEKIEDEIIEIQKAKLTKAETMISVNFPPQKENVSYDDFTKMDIRVGTILEAEKVAKTQKLLKLVIDTGIDVRTVVSGIAEYYKPEEIIGKKVSILANLAPRQIKGIESKGMILMAENSNGSLFFVSPDEQTENGGGIK